MATAFNNIYDKYEVFVSLFSKAIVIYVLLRSPERQKFVKIRLCLNRSLQKQRKIRWKWDSKEPYNQN
jgi:hypothetical protein